MKWNGFLLVVEGIDGSGKTTLAKTLADTLEVEGHSILRTKEPTDGPFGKKAKEITINDSMTISPQEEWKLFHEDRRQHVQTKVIPALQAGQIVVQDRSWPSTVAYQGERGLDRYRLAEAERLIAPQPDLLLVVDIDPKISLQRIALRQKESHAFEKLEFLNRVRKVFLSLEDKIVIDGNQTPQKVVEDALIHIREKINVWRQQSLKLLAKNSL